MDIHWQLLNVRNVRNYIAAIEQARKQEDMTLFYAVICDAIEYVLDAYLQAAEESNI